jgi:hypothetical protein
MANQSQFSEFVASKLQHYVYRLIDPRNGATFYVGRGQGNRVFTHASGSQESVEAGASDDNLKMKTIRQIEVAGFEVEHVIHRHGLSENEAKVVESALIDAYQGLSNLQRYPDRGVMHAREVIRLYEAPLAIFKHKVLLLNVSKMAEERSIYDAVRFCWSVALDRAKNCDYVLAIQRGMILRAFRAEEWLEATPDHFPGFPVVNGRKYGFVGSEAPKEVQALYCQKRLPRKYRGQGPRYVEPCAGQERPIPSSPRA